MKSLLLAIAVAGFAVSGAVGSTVIREYSGTYVRNDHYTIDRSGGNDIGVRLRHGSVQSILWRFEAFDSVTGPRH